MILSELEKTVCKEDKNGAVKPLYNGYSLVNVPYTIIHLLGKKPTRPALNDSILNQIDTKNVKKVVLFLIDGLGYNMFLNCYKDSDFLSNLAENGIVAPITSNFPPTTAASITTINTGDTPQEHGLPEWNLYFREVNSIIKPLPLVTIDEKREPLEKIRQNPKILYDGETIYKKMGKTGIKSYIIQNTGFADSTYNRLLNEGGAITKYTTDTDMAIKTKDMVEKVKTGYIYSYTDCVDFTTHVYGPMSEESRSQIIDLGNILQNNLIRRVDKKAASETLILMTADHGHIKVDPRKIIFLDEDKKLTDAYELGPDKKPILPVGFPRDVFLHIKEEKLEETCDYLRGKIGKDALILKTNDAVSMGLFGTGSINTKFYDRIGNLILLPKGDKQIWYSKFLYDTYTKGNKIHMLGMHGGFSRDEMVIPFAAARLSDLTKA